MHWLKECFDGYFVFVSKRYLAEAGVIQPKREVVVRVLGEHSSMKDTALSRKPHRKFLDRN